MTVLNISNVININVQEAQLGIATKNANNVVLFSNEAPNFPEPFIYCVDPYAAAIGFGVTSLTYQMVNALFSQSPNILSGDGQLSIVPLLDSVSATSGYVTLPGVNANVSNFNAVTNGSFKITIDGYSPIVITGLNFKNIVTLQDIANVIQNSLQDAIVTVVDNGSELVITSKKVGSSSGIVLSSNSTGIDITVGTLLDIATVVTSSGANATGETISSAITRTQGQVQYTGVLTTLVQDDSAAEATMATVNGLDLIYYQPVSSSYDISGPGLGAYAVSHTDNKSRILGYTPGVVPALIMAAAACGRGQSVDFTGSNTLLTMNLKTLTGIGADEGINQTIYDGAAANGVDLYVDYGVPAYVSNGANNYFDAVYIQLALKFFL